MTATELYGRWVAKALLVFAFFAVVMWDYIGPRPAKTFTVGDVLGGSFLFAVVFVVGYDQGRKDWCQS